MHFTKLHDFSMFRKQGYFGFLELGVLRRVCGNEKCADCGAPEPDWASLNLGVLVCIECSGVHRILGVHISKQNIWGTVIEAPVSSSNTAGNEQNKGKRKMRVSEALASLAVSFAATIETSKENAKVIADAISGMQGAKLGEELVSFGFPVEEILRAGQKFGGHPELMSIYWGLPPELKKAYVRGLLDSDI